MRSLWRARRESWCRWCRCVVHHHGVQLVQRQGEVEQVVKVEGSAEHIVALVSTEEQHNFRIVRAKNG